MRILNVLPKAEQRREPADQHEPDYLAWLSGGDTAFAMFFKQDAPRVAALDDPWTLEGLQTAVATARETFPDYRAVVAPENRSAIDRFGRFVGEVFVRRFEGHWCNMPDNAPAGVDFWPMVECGGYLACITPHSQLEIAVVEGRMPNLSAAPDGILTGLFDSVQRSYHKWVTADRPSLDVWATAKLAS
ncbi:hypothetical protein BJY24_005022 [Nocardia transvalensis]|uniref:Uncharacterized protein n=1 Tax=Nocardia transvalensis TaxID=37333 RepID=A0A7W9UKZ0_9NOCA|nr:hypothetical protein [Nocardia transvalensis]MBB5916110.1 hypothetical protein [Nocardia transvalensis]